MRAKLTILFVCLLASFAGATLAQTPDGLTPAVETVCTTSYTGASFGLCNAYCEAMDCHLENDGDTTTSPSASSTACDKVRTNFSKKSGVADTPAAVDAVCGVACPCFANWPFEGTPDIDGTWGLIVSNPDGCDNDLSGKLFAFVKVDSGSDFDGWATVSVADSTCTHGGGFEGQGSPLNTLNITADQAAACQTALETACSP